MREIKRDPWKSLETLKACAHLQSITTQWDCPLFSFISLYILSSFPCPLPPHDKWVEGTKKRHKERGVEVTGTSPNETEAQNTANSLILLIVPH